MARGIGMRKPKKKQVPQLGLTLVREALHARLRQQYAGAIYDEPRPCPRCGSTELYDHTPTERTFCLLITEDGFEKVRVTVARFRCKECGRVFLAADAPFYDRCKYGAPIVDTCLWLAASMPYNRVEHTLQQFGIQVDRDTVKRYVKLFGQKAEELAGIGGMGEHVGVNMLKLLFRADNVAELREAFPEKMFDAVADETYPAMRGAKTEMQRENRRKKWHDESPEPYPDGWCVASAYLPHLQLFASLICSPAYFNWVLAGMLLSPLDGTTMLCTDGAQAYNTWNPEPCLVHKFRNLIKNSEIHELRKELHPDVFSEALRFLFREFKDQMVELLKKKYPDLVKDQQFQGCTSTNAIEGGNWRLKWNLRTSYSNRDGIAGRLLLMTLQDSLYVFRNGEPRESFAHAESQFELGMVMDETLPPSPQPAEARQAVVTA